MWLGCCRESGVGASVSTYSFADAPAVGCLCLCVSVQEVDGEVQSLYREFQAEKEDLLDSIRLLGHQVLLKDAIIAAFIPQVSRSKGVLPCCFVW